MDRSELIGKSKILVGILALATLLVLGLSGYFWSSWQNAATSKQGGVEAIANLLTVNQNLSQRLSSLQENLAALQSEVQTLAQEKDQLDQEIIEIETEVNLLRSQKYYLADVLDWYNQQYLYPRPPLNCLDITLSCPNRTGARDVGYMADAYAKATGNPIPQSCEVASADRFLRWASLQSRMYEVTPEKMGWVSFSSVFTNILFGPDHAPDQPGYLGSLGYELRYPLVPGTWPFQELHTTINAYSVEQNSEPKDGVLQTVELDCGIQGTVYQASKVDETKQIVFDFGTINANVKLKYFYKDLSEAIPILIQAANVIIHDFTIGW